MAKSSKTSPSIEDLRKRVLEMLVRGECEVAEQHDGRIYRLKATKGGNASQIRATIEDIEKTITKHGLVLVEEGSGKRRYRRPSEREDPSAAANAEVNRLRKNFQARVLPDLIDEVDAAIRLSGKSKQEWVEEALREKLEREQ